MNLEQVQKINKLAVDLMRQGLASNREEAITQAEKIFVEDDVVGYNSIKETMKKVEAEKRLPEVSSAESESKDQEVLEISSSEVRTILEQNTKFLVKTIRDFQEKIAGLEKEISSLKNELRYQKLPTVNQIVSKKVASPLSEVESSNRDVPKSHPRSGDFTNEDVSIEKFFYYGK